MKTWRMSISWMMGLVLFCALSLAAFRSLSAGAAHLAFTTMWAALLAGVIASRYGRHRTFWDGFWIVGVAYAFLAFAPGAATEIRPYLLTSLILDEIAERLELPKRAGWSQFGRISATRLGAFPALSRITAMRPGAFPALGGLHEGDRYLRIGHSVAAVVHGIGGGVVAVVLAARGRRRVELEEGG